MARRKKRRDAKWRYARRLLLVGSWVLLLVVILGAVLRWGVTGARRSLEIDLGARLRDSLEVVKLPDLTPSHTSSHATRRKARCPARAALSPTRQWLAAPAPGTTP